MGHPLSKIVTRTGDSGETGLDPGEQPRLLFVLGRTYVSAGRQEEGVATFEVIVRQFPQSPMAQKAKEPLTTLRRRR